MEKYMFITFASVGWVLQWFVLLDENNEPFKDFDEAFSYCRDKFGKKIQFGLSTYKQMKMNNTMRDNL